MSQPPLNSSDLDRGFYVTDSGITVVGKGVLVTP